MSSAIISPPAPVGAASPAATPQPTGAAVETRHRPLPAGMVYLLLAFEALRAIPGYAMHTWFEANTPGAEESLIAWADSHALRVSQKTITPPGVPQVVVTTVRIENASGTQIGPSFSVQREVLS